MPLRDDEVVHHAAIGRLEAFEAFDMAIGADRAEADFGAQRAGGGVTEEDEFASQRVDLGMRRERAIQPASEKSRAACRQRRRVDLDRRMSLLERQQAARVRDHVGVRHTVVSEASVRAGGDAIARH